MCEMPALYYLTNSLFVNASGASAKYQGKVDAGIRKTGDSP